MAMMPDDDHSGEDRTATLGMRADDEEAPPGAARAVVGAWAVSWVGTVVVAMAWLVSLSFDDTGDEGLSWIGTFVVAVLIYTLIPALVGLVLLLVPFVLGVRRPVPDWAVVVVATVVGGVAGQVLDLSIQAGAVPALIGSIAGIAVLRARTALAGWTVVVVTLGLVLAFGRLLSLL